MTQENTEYAQEMIGRLTGAVIVSFGGNEHGEVLLTTIKDGELTEFVFSGEPDGSVSLAEVESGE